MLKYKTGRCFYDVSASIYEVEIERETESSVWIGNRREAKKCEWHTYHDTWGIAHKYLTRKANEKVEAAKTKLEAAIKNRDEVLRMEPPNEP